MLTWSHCGDRRGGGRAGGDRRGEAAARARARRGAWSAATTAAPPRDRAPRGPRSCCGRTSPRAPARRRAASWRAARGPARASKANSTVASASSSTRRSPLSSRKASVPVTRLAGLEHELHPRAVERVRRAGRVDRRVDDPERRRRRVLGRARRVRVQRVALVEQRGEQALDAHSSSRTVSSNVWQPALGLAPRQRLERLVPQPDPAAAGVVGGDRAPPDLDRHPPARRAAPRHEHDLQPVVGAAVEHRAVEVEAERHVAVVERVEVLGRGHLEVVRARHLERERGRAAERRHERLDARPLERVRRRAPALGRPEQLDQPLALGVVVGAPRRVDLDLGRERDRVDLAALGLRRRAGGSARPGVAACSIGSAPSDRELERGRRGQLAHRTIAAPRRSSK